MKEELKLARRMGIGGSDVAPILGFSPWRCAMDVWLEKKGFEKETPRDPHREFLLSLGIELEPVIAKLYERETRRILIPPGETVWRHKEYGCLIGSPDRFVEGYTRGVELKTENQFSHEFGDAGTADVPVHYALQCAHYMAVCDIDVWDVAVLHGGARFAVYTLERDRELEAAIIEKLVEWWQRHIIADIPPDADSSDAWKLYLKRKFPSDLLPTLVADEGDNGLLGFLADVRELRDRAEKCIAETETKLKLRIGAHCGIEGQAGRATWKKTKDVSKVNWPEVVRQLEPLVSRETVARILQDCTTITPGARRFLFTASEERKHGDTGVEAAVGEILNGNRAQITETRTGDSDGAGASESADRSALRDGRETSARS